MTDLPSDQDLERVVLGAMCRSADARSRGVERLQSSAFTRRDHRLAFLWLAQCQRNSVPASPEAVTKSLPASHAPLACFLDSLEPSQTPTSFEDQLTDLIEMAARRELILEAGDIVRAAREGQRDVHDLLDSLERRLYLMQEGLIGRPRDAARAIEEEPEEIPF